MKSIFNPNTSKDLIARAQNITSNSKAQWGKMNSYQMMVHCIKNAELLQTKKQYPRLFIGRLFGKMALKSTLKNDKPMSKNSPTHPEFVIKDEGQVSDVKDRFIQSIEAYNYCNSEQYRDFVHPFFGKMTMTQVGQWEYKHLDHHLRQFGA